MVELNDKDMRMLHARSDGHRDPQLDQLLDSVADVPFEGRGDIVSLGEILETLDVMPCSSSIRPTRSLMWMIRGERSGRRRSSVSIVIGCLRDARVSRVEVQPNRQDENVCL